jgi:outer membrane protein insertion porin family
MRSLKVLLLCFLLFRAMGLAQVAPQTPQASYEGQNVSAVSLIANPHRDLEPLRACVTLKPGDLYSEDKIRASAEALEKAGGFPKVQVSVVPDSSGLRISFLLEPAYFLGVVDFSGVGKSLSYTRLLQAVDLPDEDPFDPSRLPTAEEALTTFLHKNGFFQAKVHTDTKTDDAHQLISVSFAVEMGKQARSGSLEIVGPAAAERAELHHSVQSLRARLSGGFLKPGKVYDQERIGAATTLLKKALAKQHRLSAKVHENPPEYHPETNRVDVSFKIEVGPVVTVRAVGARISRIPFLAGRQMKKLIPIYSEGAIDQDLVDEGHRNLTDYFQKKGFADVKVTSSIQKQPDQILVVYQIDRGRKHRVDRVLFHGNSTLSQKALMALVVSKKSHIWTHGSFSQKLLKQSSDNIQAVYQDRGYEDVKVTAQAVDREPKIDVTFEIEEGPQTIVEDVKISGNENVPYAELTAPNGPAHRILREN